MTLLSHQNLATTEILSRLGTAAAVAGVPSDALLGWVSRHELDVSSFARIGIDDGFSRLSLQLPWPATRAAAILAAIAETQPAIAGAMESALARPDVAGGDLMFELATEVGRADLGFAVHVRGGRPLILDALLLDGAIGGCPALNATLISLAKEPSSVGISIGNEPLSAGGEAVSLALTGAIHVAVPPTDDGTAALLATAKELCVASAQQTLLGDIHSILSRGKSTMVSLASVAGSDGAALAEALCVTYRELPMTHLVRILVGLHRGTDIGAKLGAFAGAFDVDHASAFSLTLTPRAPRAQVFVDYHEGRAV